MRTSKKKKGGGNKRTEQTSLSLLRGCRESCRGHEVGLALYLKHFLIFLRFKVTPQKSCSVGRAQLGALKARATLASWRRGKPGGKQVANGIKLSFSISIANDWELWLTEAHCPTPKVFFQVTCWISS